MSIISAPQQFACDDLFVDLAPSLDIPLYLKIEGQNLAGSVKIKAATAMIDAAEAEGRLSPWSVIVESSSGNLGVALAMVAANRGYRFLCVTDAKCNPATRRLIEAYGAELHVIETPHPETGYLGARLDFIATLVADGEDHVWLNQYANAANPGAHYDTTAPSIAANIPDVQVVFVGAGTTGTLMGVARWFTAHRPDVRIIAVDTDGSVSFGGTAKPRHIPGLVNAAIERLGATLVDDVVIVPEADTVATCLQMAARGFLFGGSTGTVVAGARAWLAANGNPEITAVAISPDMGERYLDTVYNSEWRAEHFGDDDTAIHTSCSIGVAMV